MRVLLTGGGTGGHVNPALAIAEIIKSREPDSEIAFIGTERGIENNLIPKEGYKLYHNNVYGIRRSLSPKNIITAYYILTSPAKAKKIIREFEPDVVIGTGGYVCWPNVKAAAKMGIPTVLHESNATPGLAVRKLQKTADIIMTNFESTLNTLNTDKKAIRVGNPLRIAYSSAEKAQARKKLGIPDNIKFVVLSFGGSLGAEKLNESAMDIMREFSAKHDDVMHIHSGGKRFYDDARQLFAAYGLEKNPRLDLREYIHDMATYMAAADLVICRAGAMTLTELSVTKKASILIPSPNVTGNHQYKNAAEFEKAGAAILIEEKDLTRQSVVYAVEKIYSDPKLRAEMGEAASKLSSSDAADKIYEEISTLVKNNKKIKGKR